MYRDAWTRVEVVEVQAIVDSGQKLTMGSVGDATMEPPI